MNESAARTANERFVARATSERVQSKQRVPLVCECADPGCRELVMLGIDDYHRIRSHPARFLLAAGHEDEVAHERVIEAENGYAIVEKHGTAGREAARLDPRAADNQ